MKEPGPLPSPQPASAKAKMPKTTSGSAVRTHRPQDRQTFPDVGNRSVATSLPRTLWFAIRCAANKASRRRTGPIGPAASCRMTRNPRFVLGLLSFMTFSAQAVGEVLTGPLANGGGGRIVRHQARRVRLIQRGQPASRPRGFPRAGLAVRPNLALCVRRIAVSCVFGNTCNYRLQPGKARETREKAMSVAWLDWSNPVAIWWGSLLAVSAVNVAVLFGLCFGFRDTLFAGRTVLVVEPLLLLAAVYVVGCAFRSVLPRADVQRICLFDTWLSSVMVGRSVATVAELAFAAQWAIVLHALGKAAHSDTAKSVAKTILPLIAFAEICSWYAVITTDFLGNILENSLWMVTFLLIGVALSRLVIRFHGVVQFAIAAATAGIAGYVVFMATID